MAGSAGYVLASLSGGVCSSMFVAEFREDVRITIPTIMAGLKDSDWVVRMVAVNGVSRVAAQGMC